MSQASLTLGGISKSSDKQFGPVRFGYVDLTLSGDVGFSVYCQELECDKVKRSWNVQRKWQDYSAGLSVPIQLNGWPKAAKLKRVVEDIINNMNLIGHLIDAAKTAYPLMGESPTAICIMFPNG